MEGEADGDEDTGVEGDGLTGLEGFCDGDDGRGVEDGALVLTPTRLDEGVTISEITWEEGGMMVATGEDVTMRVEETDKVETTGDCEPTFMGGTWEADTTAEEEAEDCVLRNLRSVRDFSYIKTNLPEAALGSHDTCQVCIAWGYGHHLAPAVGTHCSSSPSPSIATLGDTGILALGTTSTSRTGKSMRNHGKNDSHREHRQI